MHVATYRMVYGERVYLFIRIIWVVDVKGSLDSLGLPLIRTRRWMYDAVSGTLSRPSRDLLLESRRHSEGSPHDNCIIYINRNLELYIVITSYTAMFILALLTQASHDLLGTPSSKSLWEYICHLHLNTWLSKHVHYMRARVCACVCMCTFVLARVDVCIGCTYVCPLWVHAYLCRAWYWKSRVLS